MQTTMFRKVLTIHTSVSKLYCPKKGYPFHNVQTPESTDYCFPNPQYYYQNLISKQIFHPQCNVQTVESKQVMNVQTAKPQHPVSN